MAFYIPDLTGFDPRIAGYSKQPGSATYNTYTTDAPSRTPLQDITQGRPTGQVGGVKQHRPQNYHHDYLRTTPPTIKLVYEDGSMSEVGIKAFKIMVGTYRPLPTGATEHFIRVDVVIPEEQIDPDIFRTIPLTATPTLYGKEYHMTVRIPPKDIYVATDITSGAYAYHLAVNALVQPKDTPSKSYVFTIALDPDYLYVGIDSKASKFAARGWLLPNGIKPLTHMR